MRVDARSGVQTLIWSTHCPTTNSLIGLRAARHYQWPQLKVVGDSALVLRQLSDYLLALYVQARCAALVSPCAANLAMDCRTSS
jgi:hypothetical protein